ncbi:hypothetical protein NPX79_00495 [Spiroplasma endosymbiont of Anurida maritima]|uniref:hypothetical protein n=1 Tax=Spiroplasma endosymbiont of Anurida maritima TaxID=2967972 RepID=UPI0036D34D9A
MDVIKKVWNIILNFTSYGFNKSHAISYSLISYYFVYFKLFYPAIYFETLFLDNSTHKDREAIFDEAKEKNILFKSSNFTDNNYNEFEIKDNILYIPLNLYINLDLEVYQKLVAIRKEQTQNINPYYFLLKVITTIDWNIDLFKKLTLSGYFNFLNMNPATVLKCLESYDISTFKSVYDIKTNTTLNGWVPDIVHQPANTKDILFDWKIWIYILEEAHNLFGFYIFGSPISLIIDFKKLNKNITKLNDILNGNTVRSQKVIFKIKSIKIIKDKSGSEMCFLTVMDDTEQMEGTIFAKDFSRFNDILFEEEYYISIVSSNEYKGKKTIIINDIQKIIF